MSVGLSRAEGPFLVLGLGNPGPKYHRTRHNMGFMVVEELGRRHGVLLSKKKLSSLWGKGRIGAHQVILAQPQTFMNLSGQAAEAIKAYFDIDDDRIIAVHDDLDIEFGRIKIARRGSSGGHKGIASLIKHLGTDAFTRIKVGIGRPRYGETVEDFVLERTYSDQLGEIREVIGLSADCLEVILDQGVAEAMQRFHTVT